MLFKREVLDRVVAGEVDLAFRNWLRPQAASGGSLRTDAGVVAFDAVEPVAPEDITDADARRAGFAGRPELLASLRPGAGRRTYRLTLRYAGADPRAGLRAAGDLPDGELAEAADRLARIDARSRRGPWTADALALLAERPGVRAADLAASAGRETARFKADVRRLKDLGLTESLETGYRLSPRGRQVLAYVTSHR
ncbi:hypothetical protein [Streptomyces sp. 184]|uniref:hypothetical protein n=1 Tax=Streptomyces sp. 184 TaxID=1827526 RepID=UPI003892B78D